jgi:rare lipoprotein A
MQRHVHSGLASRLDRYRLAGTVVLLAALLGGCASPPSRPARDGPPADPPAGLASVPDAQPRLEAIRSGGPNKPYVVFGRRYVPMTEDQPFAERGLASWYGRKFQGLPTSSGEPYDMYAMTAAHPTVPIPSYVWVRNPANGREVLLRVNDRGPFHPGRIIDLSYTAALKLDLLRGVAPVEIERITYAAIRTGAWRREADAPRYAMAQPDAGLRGDAATATVPASSTGAPAASVAEAPAMAAAGDAASAASRSTPAASLAMPGASPTMPVADAATTADTAALAAAMPLADARQNATSLAVTVPAGAAATAAATDAGSARGFWVQLGAFRERDGADSFQRRIAGELAWLTPLLTVFDEASLFRLQAGPYASRERARDAADSIRAALQLVPLIVERR